MNRLNYIKEHLNGSNIENASAFSKILQFCLGDKKALCNTSKDVLLQELGNYEIDILFNYYKNIYMEEHYLDWMNDFYNESPNWMLNDSITHKNHILNWIQLDNVKKEQILNTELDNYFNVTRDGEL